MSNETVKVEYNGQSVEVDRDAFEDCISLGLNKFFWGPVGHSRNELNDCVKMARLIDYYDLETWEKRANYADSQNWWRSLSLYEKRRVVSNHAPGWPFEVVERSRNMIDEIFLAARE